METYFTYTNLYKAYLACRKRKTHTRNHLVFAENLEENLIDLETSLLNRTYQPGRSTAFVVSKPKVREIFAADFRDRVIHHLLYNYLSPKYEKLFIYDSWACRKGKGTHQGMLRLQKFCQKSVREKQQFGTKDKRAPYYLKLDIKSFFTSIDQQILFDLIVQKFKNEEILWLVKQVIFHDCARDIPPKIQSKPSLFDALPPEKSLFKVARGKGLPIGNLTSQFFANVYLDKLDQFVKHTLKARNYVRYVDDFVIISNNRSYLEDCQIKIDKFIIGNLGLTLHPHKQIIRPVSCGLDFVGYIVGSNHILVRRRMIDDYRFKVGLTRYKSRRYKELVSSYKSQFDWANSISLQMTLAPFTLSN